MKKIPTLFERKFVDGKLVGITPSVNPEFEWVFEGEGVATAKFDGACCAIINGEFYKRYDAKRGKTPPAGAIPCSEPDPITGHWPHWVMVDWDSPADKWFVDAYISSGNGAQIEDGTYEAIGKMFQGNPYNIYNNVLVKHGSVILELPDLSFEGIRNFLFWLPIEGIVWWKEGEPQCKIKRTDFGFPWPLDHLAAERRDAFLADIERTLTVTQVDGGVCLNTGDNVVNETDDGSLKCSTLRSPCDLCMYSPPSSMDGKPCCYCPACALQR